MAIATKCLAVADIKSLFWEPAERLDVVRMEMASTRAAGLTRIVISLKNGLTPNLVLNAASKCTMLKINPAAPEVGLLSSLPLRLGTTLLKSHAVPPFGLAPFRPLARTFRGKVLGVGDAALTQDLLPCGLTRPLPYLWRILYFLLCTGITSTMPFFERVLALQPRRTAVYASDLNSQRFRTWSTHAAILPGGDGTDWIQTATATNL